MIDENRLLAALIPILNKHGDMYLAGRIVALLKNQPKIGEWIPCSERLPDIEADVLLSLRNLDIYTGFRANTEGMFFVEGEGYVEYENVLAWQPLPEPHREGDA